jgi:hypothetical protein
MEEKYVGLELDRLDRNEVIAAKVSVPGHSPVRDIPVDR